MVKRRIRGLFLGGLFLVAAGFATVWQPREHVSARENAPVMGAFYAAPAEEVETHVLSRGETLTGILSRSSITGLEQTDLILAMRRFINPRRLGTSTEVTVRRLTGDGSPRSVDVRVNPDTTVRIENQPMAGWTSRVVVTPVTTDTVFVAGTIDEGRTLYASIATDESLDLPVEDRYKLVDELVEIYQYKLNFREIKPGDGYRLVYHREVRPDGTARRQQVLAAEVLHQGRAVSAIHFDPRGDGGAYYDLEGRSLRFQFRQYPMSFRAITSGVGRRFHPIKGAYRAHNGTDFGAAHGTPIKATGDGTVVSAGKNGGYGNMVVLNHPGGYSTRYAHMSRFAAGIRPGARVKEGQVIGYVGSTGLSTGPHLHYELRKGGRVLDPRTAKLPGAPPLPAAQRGVFDRIARERVAILDLATSKGAQLATDGRDESQENKGT